MYTKEEFLKDVGRQPTNDDIERCNCDNEGDLGHWQCGICVIHNKPRFICGCLNKVKER